jgi:predicted Holliday junction resolvase-like endonuclease
MIKNGIKASVDGCFQDQAAEKIPMDSFAVIVILGLLILLCLAIALLAILIYRYLSVRSQLVAKLQEARELWRAQELAPALREQSSLARQEAQAQFRQWRDQELDLARKQQFDIAQREAQAHLEQWKLQQEQVIRQDAIQRSQSVTAGKITEHLVPYLPGFAFSPKDARFIGSPIDLVIFDGLSEGDGTVRRIVFVEVKTGASNLSTRERRVRDAIQAGRVEWLELHPAVDANRAGPDGRSAFSATAN